MSDPIEEEPMPQQKISPFLWFNGNAEEAMRFYVSVFKNSQAGEVRRIGKGGPMPEGTVLTCSFQLEGQDFTALNGGPEYKFTPAISFFVNCDSQEEVDALWDRLLSGGGKELQCGWLTDKFGVAWQIIPRALEETLWNPDPDKAARAMQALMKMVKIDIKKLKEAIA
jgi:predicted 3-demethylubiquinone-9 3-methyltransferase (glyoxalase superfamily)